MSFPTLTTLLSYIVSAHLLNLKIIYLKFHLNRVPRGKNTGWKVTPGDGSQDLLHHHRVLTLSPRQRLLSHFLGQHAKYSRWVRAPDTPLSGQPLCLGSNTTIRPPSKDPLCHHNTGMTNSTDRVCRQGPRSTACSTLSFQSMPASLVSSIFSAKITI